MKFIYKLLAISTVTILTGCTTFYDEDPVHDLYEKQMADHSDKSLLKQQSVSSDPVKFFISYIDSKKTVTDKILGLIAREKYTIDKQNDHVSVRWREFLSSETDKSSGSLGVAFNDFCNKNQGVFVGHWCVSQKLDDSSLLFYFRASQSVEYSASERQLKEYVSAELLAPVDGYVESNEWNKFAYKNYINDQKQIKKQNEIEKKELENFLRYLEYKKVEPKIIEASIGHQVCKILRPPLDFPMAVGVVEAAKNGKVKIRLTSWYFANYRKPYPNGTVVWDDSSNWSLCQ